MNLLDQTKERSYLAPRWFIPSLYFAEGLPYTAVLMLSVVFFNRMGIGNAKMAFWTSLLYLPWIIKFLWSPWVDSVLPKREWIWLTQLALGFLFLLQGFWFHHAAFFPLTLLTLYALAMLSATHDVAADGYYLLSLTPHKRALYIGISSTMYRVAMVFGQGALVMLAGYIEISMGSSRAGVQWGWSAAFVVLGVLFLLLSAWHRFGLPYPAEDGRRQVKEGVNPLREAFGSYLAKPGMVPSILLLLTYRLGESQLVKLSAPFLLDSREVGGLGLTTAELGFVQGVVGVSALVTGGILGGVCLARWGLSRLFVPMWVALNLPNLLYVWMSTVQPQDSVSISTCVAIEQLGYGFGYSAYMLFVMNLAGKGEWKTAHLAFGTGIMAAGMMLPGLFAGALQEWIGYAGFFRCVVLFSLPGLYFVLHAPSPTDEATS